MTEILSNIVWFKAFKNKCQVHITNTKVFSLHFSGAARRPGSERQPMAHGEILEKRHPTQVASGQRPSSEWWVKRFLINCAHRNSDDDELISMRESGAVLIIEKLWLWGRHGCKQSTYALTCGRRPVWEFHLWVLRFEYIRQRENEESASQPHEYAGRSPTCKNYQPSNYALKPHANQ